MGDARTVAAAKCAGTSALIVSERFTVDRLGFGRCLCVLFVFRFLLVVRFLLVFRFDFAISVSPSATDQIRTLESPETPPSPHARASAPAQRSGAASETPCQD